MSAVIHAEPVQSVIEYQEMPVIEFRDRVRMTEIVLIAPLPLHIPGSLLDDGNPVLKPKGAEYITIAHFRQGIDIPQYRSRAQGTLFEGFRVEMVRHLPFPCDLFVPGYLPDTRGVYFAFGFGIGNSTLQFFARSSGTST